MKKKVFGGLIVLIVCFLAGSFYITQAINSVVNKLENLVALHQVEHLRNHLLNKVNVVQADLLLKSSPHARDINIFVRHVEEMEKAANVCLSCHHTSKVLKRLESFQGEINKYLHKLSRVYTLRARHERLAKERQSAFDFGKNIIAEVHTLEVASAEKISLRAIEARDKITSTRQLLTTLITVGPVFIVIIAFYFLRRFTGSVTTLINATRKIKDGDLQYRIQNNLKDEFQELASAFNEMAESIKSQCVKLQQTERLAAVGEISAGLAHEVKNPLAGIKVSIEVLSDDLQLEQEDKEIFLRVINEINRIESLLKSLLNYARPPMPVFVSLDIHTLLNGAIKNARYSLKSPADVSKKNKEIDFVKEFSADVSSVIADPGQLQQVFLNLFLNAVDAIPDRGQVTVITSKASSDTIQIVISDTGKGMDSQTLEKIFNPFYTTKPNGTGLGLAICKRLIEQHDGTIDVSNRPEGGTAFTITLPEKKEVEVVE